MAPRTQQTDPVHVSAAESPHSNAVPDVHSTASRMQQTDPVQVSSIASPHWSAVPVTHWVAPATQHTAPVHRAPAANAHALVPLTQSSSTPASRADPASGALPPSTSEVPPSLPPGIEGHECAITIAMANA